MLNKTLIHNVCFAVVQCSFIYYCDKNQFYILVIKHKKNSAYRS